MKKLSLEYIGMALCLTGCTQSSVKAATTRKSLVEMPVIESCVNAYLQSVDSEYGYDIAVTLSEDAAYHDSSLGYRTAGSDAEHRAAEYLSGVMTDLGLEVEMSPATVDKWQFTGASLTIEGTGLSMDIGSYAQSGTPPEGITAQIVDVGAGFQWDYENVDVEGKIVIAGVDQYHASWIDAYLTEAYNHGAVAFISYDAGGYGENNDNLLQIQDARCEDLIPCAMVSYNDYRKIAKAISKGNDIANLVIDSVLEDNTGVSYNVIGKIPGKSSDNQIVISAHYDMYFKSFQDDCIGVGLILSMAKGMKDAGYQPENDILFVCHGAGEWGAMGTSFDRSAGSWGLLTQAHPEWAGKTLAALNFELPAVYDQQQSMQVGSVPEFSDLFSHLVKETSLIADPYLNIYPKGIVATTKNPSSYEDGVSYRYHGIPSFVNDYLRDENRKYLHTAYHTTADLKNTYHDHIMRTNLNTFGALAIYLDQMPALELNISASLTDLLNGLDEKTAKNAGIDYREFSTKLRDTQYYAEEHNNRIHDLNQAYLDALNKGEDTRAIREEGRRLNAITLQAYRYVQDHFVGILSSGNTTTRHGGYQGNIGILNQVIAALEAGVLYDEKEYGALDQASKLNGSQEWLYFQFSPDTARMRMQRCFEQYHADTMFWAAGKGFAYAETGDATVSLMEKNENRDTDFSYELEIYRNVREKQQRLMKEAVETEYKDLDGLRDILQE